MSAKYYFWVFLIGASYIFYLFIIWLRTKTPYASTPKKYFVNLIKELPINSHSVIYDLGSGKGDALFAAEAKQPASLIGWELSPLHCYYAKLKAKFIGSRAKFYCRDFFSADIGKADIIYLFLVKSVIKKLWPKIKLEAKSGCLIVVLSEDLPEIKPVKVIYNNPKIPNSRFNLYYLP